MTNKEGVAGETFLRGVDIFQDLTPEEVSELQRKVHFKEVAAGTVFYESHESCEIIFFLKKGRVRLYHLSAEGKTLDFLYFKRSMNESTEMQCGFETDSRTISEEIKGFGKAKQIAV